MAKSPRETRIRKQMRVLDSSIRQLSNPLLRGNRPTADSRVDSRAPAAKLEAHSAQGPVAGTAGNQLLRAEAAVESSPESRRYSAKTPISETAARPLIRTHIMLRLNNDQ